MAAITINEFFDLHHGRQDWRKWALSNCTDMHDVWVKSEPEMLFWIAEQPGVLTSDESEPILFCFHQDKPSGDHKHAGSCFAQMLAILSSLVVVVLEVIACIAYMWSLSVWPKWAAKKLVMHLTIGVFGAGLIVSIGIMGGFWLIKKMFRVRAKPLGIVGALIVVVILGHDAGFLAGIVAALISLIALISEWRNFGDEISAKLSANETISYLRRHCNPKFDKQLISSRDNRAPIPITLAPITPHNNGEHMKQYPYAMDYDDPVLAELYDRHQSYEDDIALIRRLIDGQNSLAILECFCGTGRIAIPLAADGHQVTGIDIASAMIARAEAKASQKGVALDLKIQDVVAGCWGSGYDLVLLAANAFYELPDAESQRRCVTHAYEALRPDGLLFVDNDNYQGDWGNTPLGKVRKSFEGETEHGEYGLLTLESLSFDQEHDILYMRRNWTRRSTDGTTSEAGYLCSKHPVSGQEVKEVLESSGFQILESFGNRAGQALAPDSERAIFWAQKK